MESQSPFQVDRLATLPDLDALEKDWADLIAGIPDAPIFLTWEWMRTWWLHFGKAHELWLLTARDTEGRLRGIAPFMRQSSRFGWMRIRTISFIGAGRVHPIHMDIVAHSCDLDRLYQAFLGALRRESDQWDVLSFASVAQDSATHSLLAASGGRVRVGAQTILPYIPLPGDWGSYAKALSKKLRRNLKYFRSKLEDDYPGQVEFGCVRELGEVESAMQRLGEMSQRRWHARKLSTPFEDSTYSSFHQSFARLALARGWLHLHKLTVANRVIALFYCFHFHDHVAAYQIGFDLDWSAYSPGRLLIAYAIQTAILEAASELDWGPGGYDYKLAWTEHVRFEDDFLLSGSWYGNAYIIWQNIQGALKKKARQWLPIRVQEGIEQYLARNRTIENRSDQVLE